MKKVMLFAASAAVLTLVSCGGGADKEAERKKREADSLAKVQQAYEDSVNASLAVQVVDVYETLKSNPDFSTLVGLLDQAGLSSTLQDASVNYTLFAPTNLAFDKLDAKTLADLKDAKNAAKLKDLLEYHVVRGKLVASDVAASDELQAIDEKVIAVKQSESGLVNVSGAVVTTADIDATNGVVHAVDAVLTVPVKKAVAKTVKKTTPTKPEEGVATGRGGSQTEEKATGRSGSQVEQKATGRSGN